MDTLRSKVKNSEVELTQAAGTWVPCSERLPVKPEVCIITFRVGTTCDTANRCAYYDGSVWSWAGGRTVQYDVVAWKPLPKPYEPPKEDAT